MSVPAIRSAVADDAVAIAAIYAHHVLHGTATFDNKPPNTAFWLDKIAAFDRCGWPFIVATDATELLGYACASQFRDRPAYSRTCENSIYVQAGQERKGIGHALLAALIERATARGFNEMIAVISDESASVPLHASFGFRYAGRMERVGEKFGRLIDTVYMQRTLGDQRR